MKKLKIHNDSFKIQYGRLSINEYTTQYAGSYKEGVYYHRLGIVTVYAEERYLRLDTVHNGRQYMRTIEGEFTEIQVRNQARKFITEIHDQPQH